MRRLGSIALAVLLIAIPAFAQRGGGGMRGGGGIGRAGFVGHGPVMPRAAAPAMRGGVRINNFGFGFGRPFFGGRFHHRHFFGYPFLGFGYGYYGYPFDYFPSSTDYGYESSSQSAVLYEQQNMLAEQVGELSSEVRQLREEEAQRAYASAQPPPAPGRAEVKQEPGKPTILVFQDKHTREVENYAIVGQTVWVFTEQRANKIPISELDIPATQKANDERGIEFRVPGR